MFCKFFNLPDKIVIAMEDFIKLKSGKKIGHYSIKRIVKKISNPILWIHDNDDDITPLKDVEEIIIEKPSNIIFHVTKGLGHRKIYKEPEIVEKVVEFLEF